MSSLLHPHADEWLEPLAVAWTEAPPRRRMHRPLRQHIDLKLVRAAEIDAPEVDPALYSEAGRPRSAGTRPGRLLNVHV